MANILLALVFILIIKSSDNIHMPRQLSCRGMCTIVTWFDHYIPHDCLLNGLFKRRSNKTSKLRVIGLCEGNSLVTGEFPAQMASNAENVSISWRHHGLGNGFLYVGLLRRDVEDERGL